METRRLDLSGFLLAGTGLAPWAVEGEGGCCGDNKLIKVAIHRDKQQKSLNASRGGPRCGDQDF